VLSLSALPVACQELRPFALSALTLNDAKSSALAQNREIREAVFEVNKRNAALKVIMVQRFPKLLSIGFAGQQLNQIGGDRPQNFAAIPGALEPVTQQYRLALQIKQARLEVESASQNLRLTKQRVVAEVKRIFLNAVALKSAIRSREQNLVYLKELNNYVNEQLKHGASLPVDAMQSDAQVAQADYELDRDKDELITLGQILNRLLSRDVLTPIDVVETEPVTPVNPDKKRAIDEALSQRPELKQLSLSVRTSKLSEKIELSHYIPDVSLGVLGIYSRNISPTLPITFTSLGFLATWEPWDWGRKIQLAKISEETMRQSLIALSDKRDGVIVEVDNIRRSLAVAEKQVRAATLKMSSSNEELRVLAKRYQFGSSLFKDVVETQSAYSKAIADKVAADTNYATIQVELDKALGRDFN
jgi:outer membrane protein TolC